MPSVDTFIRDNAKWLLTLVFLAGLLYGEIQNFRNVEERLSKKIKVINEVEEKVQENSNRILILENTKCPE